MIDFNIKKIVPLCESFGLLLDDIAISRLNTYGNMLIEWCRQKSENVDSFLFNPAFFQQNPIVKHILSNLTKVGRESPRF